MTQYTLIDTDAKAEVLINRLLADAPMMYPFDIETTGLSPHGSQILLIQFQIPSTREIYVINCVSVSHGWQLKILNALWRDGAGHLLGHNLKFDLSFLNVKFPSIYFHEIRDTYIIEQLITNGIVMKPPSLAELLLKYMNIEMDKEQRSTFVNWTGEDFTPEQLEYAAKDVEFLKEIYLTQRKHIDRLQLGLITDIECRAVSAFAKMETDGIFVSKEKWNANIHIAKRRRLDTLQKINDYAVQIFPPKIDLFQDNVSAINWNSPLQVLTLLQKLVSSKIKDTNEKTLLMFQHTVIDLLLEYREQEKVITSYGDTVLSQINKKTGRLHPSFNQIGAKTGRVSCREPNVQQVPKNTIVDSDGKKHAIYREAFIPQIDTGYMVGADYSSFELRVLTDLTKEEKWIEGYHNNSDMHSVVATFVFNVKVSKTEHPELREIGKAVNFGIAWNPCAIKTRSIAGTPNVKTRAISSQTPKKFGSNGSTTAYFIYG